MDRRIFDQLDTLERGACIERRPRRDAYLDDRHEHAAYDARVSDYGYGHDAGRGYGYGGEEFVNQPMVLDSFDEQLLRQPDLYSRHAQASRGRARLSLGPSTHPAAQDMDYELQAQFEPPTSHRPDISRFAFDTVPQNKDTSSLLSRQLPSSPAFKASQRRAPSPDRRSYQQSSLENSSNRQHTEPHSEHHPYGRRNQVEPGVVQRQVRREEHGDYQPQQSNVRRSSKPLQATNAPPVVQGIHLLSTHSLPDRFRAIFPYPLFNAVQSKSFETIYRSGDNFVLSSPTGSGKTAIMELAICRLVGGFASGSYKIVYQAPTKALCSERQRDWQAKFGPLDLQCAELTGDTDQGQLRNVQHASIIITTPEKWDSMTRKWKDQQRLMQMVKLFLIDEVHILKEDRGATLEAVVSRMKSVGPNVRFVALSATIPNSEDIATWLGKDPMNQDLPAATERFGEEFRPVKLRKEVVGYACNSNDFAFDKTLNGKLPEVIAKYSERKPIMVFCFTRASCLETAKMLANWWETKGPKERYWSAPRERIVVGENDLRGTISSGVAFHHAGLNNEDRIAVEKAYIGGDLGVICCTSTLAVGVNLPCHMVIIKNTVAYQNQAVGCKEYSDLEIMQMLGRAGRPQFDDSAVAVIMTKQHREAHYKQMVNGQEVLESCLHRNLIDHLNAEIGLGTINSVSSAKKWLSGTFLYVRLKDNPEHYKIESDTPGHNLDQRLEDICQKGIAALQESDLVLATPKLRCSEFGDAMARYYLQFETMKTILALQPKAKVSEVLSTICQASEFRDIRFRGGEKKPYKDLNKNNSIKFPIPGNPDLPAHKVSLIIQSVLGALELPTEEYKQRMDYNSAKAAIFQHANRLVRCIIDCQLCLEDAVTTRNALMLARSLGAQVWDDSPLHMKQLEGVGIAYVRKLVAAGLTSIEDLEHCEPHQIEQALSRNPPFGTQIQDKAKAFPKLRVTIKMIGEPSILKDKHVNIKLNAEIGFLNEKIPEQFQRRPVYVCLLAETSDGHKVHFARIHARKLNKGQDVLFSAALTSATQSIHAYVMCDEIAGTMRHATLKPALPSAAFPAPKTANETTKANKPARTNPNTSKNVQSGYKAKPRQRQESEDFGDDGIDDADMAIAEVGGFVDIDEIDIDERENRQPPQKKLKTRISLPEDEIAEPRKLPNGKWACNHRCTDKENCKHVCCKEGMDKRPAKPKTNKLAQPAVESNQTKLDMSIGKKTVQPNQSTSSTKPARRSSKESQEVRNLNRLHDSIPTKTPNVPTLSKVRGNAEKLTVKSRTDRREVSSNSHRWTQNDRQQPKSSDYGLQSINSEDLLDLSELPTRRSPNESKQLDDFVDDDNIKEFVQDEEFKTAPQTQMTRSQGEQLDAFNRDDDEPGFTWPASDWVLDDFPDAVVERTERLQPPAAGQNGKGKLRSEPYDTSTKVADFGDRLQDQEPVPNVLTSSKMKPDTSSRTLSAGEDSRNPDERKRAFFANSFMDDFADATTPGNLQEDENTTPADNQESVEQRFIKEFLGTKDFTFVP